VGVMADELSCLLDLFFCETRGAGAFWWEVREGASVLVFLAAGELDGDASDAISRVRVVSARRSGLFISAMMSLMSSCCSQESERLSGEKRVPTCRREVDVVLDC